MASSVLRWSSPDRTLRQIEQVLERDGEARIEWPGGGQLVLLEAKRYDQVFAHLETLTRLMRSLLLTRSIEVAVKEAFPWSGVLPADAREEFFAGFMETFAMCKSLDVWKPLERMFTDWKATAAGHAGD